MKILSAQQVKFWDDYTITNQSVNSIDLMERAACASVKWIVENLPSEKNILVFCGKGNNGGDGLSIARLLADKNYCVQVFIDDTHKRWSENALTNFERLQQKGIIYHLLKDEVDLPLIQKNDLVIDALLGSGVNRPVSGYDLLLWKHINKAAATVISIDVPSGMPADNSCKDDTVIVATHTLGFQTKKHCFLIPENVAFFGMLHLLDIGLDKKYIDTIDTKLQLVSNQQVASLIRPRGPFSHKGTFGHALLIAGSEGKAGAAVLAAKACLRSGPGLLTVSLPGELAVIMHTSLPEAIVIKRTDIETEKYSTIGIGPGMGTDQLAAQILERVITAYKKPIVIDADGLTILSKNKGWLEKIPTGSILTPHPKEFDRLFGDVENDFARVDKAIALSKQYPFVIVLKGHYTLTAFEGRGWYNNTGNAGLAKGGSGDVLTGMITGLLAQQYAPVNAAIAGIYLHGLAADLALQKNSMESMLATDVIGHIGNAFRNLMNE